VCDDVGGGGGGGAKHDPETWQVTEGQDLGAPARMWDSVPGCLRLSDTFMMCHSNNVRETTL
jgi:hypothetical protein